MKGLKNHLFGILTLTILLYVFFLKISSNPPPSFKNELRVSFPYSHSAFFYDPAKIELAPEYIFLENAFSTLVETSVRGEIVSGISNRFEWKGDRLYLHIRSDLFTVDGIRITAEDAAFSIKRLLIRAKTHSGMIAMFCDDIKQLSINDKCNGITVEGNTLILKPRSRNTFLLPMLAAIDFAIIPKKSVDPKSLDIIDYRNTSGPYYVEQDSNEGRLILKANPNHYRYANNIPQVVSLVPSDPTVPNSVIDSFKNNKIDHITTVDTTMPESVVAYSRECEACSLFRSMDIRTILLNFSKRGAKELSSKQRFYIGKKIRTQVRELFRGIDIYKESDQLVPLLGEGAINKSQIDELRANIEVKDVSLPILKVSIVRLGRSEQIKKAIEQAIPGAIVYDSSSLPAFSKYINPSDIPHVTITGPDTGFLEDISFISYSFAAGYLGFSDEYQKNWIEKYTSIDDKVERIKMFRDLHFQALKSPVTIPISVLPYVALLRKPWKFGLSNLYANNQLWRIYQE